MVYSNILKYITMSSYHGSFYTVAEVSSLLRLSPLTIYKYIRNGTLEAIELGGHYRIESSSLRRFIESHKLSGRKHGTE